ncbi:MAG: PQQ-dependent sugar dehydrogenase, partial [Chloroflexota bacterium]|nr:PQQ-dependent sugar dehydrogenase [Chloroflexota bacterium]
MAKHLSLPLFSLCAVALLAVAAFLLAPSRSAIAQQPASSVGEPSAALELIAEGLTAPLQVEEAPDGSGRLFIVDQTGQIRIVSADGTLLEEPFLNLQEEIVELREDYDERGLLGLAFHPDYAD